MKGGQELELFHPDGRVKRHALPKVRARRGDPSTSHDAAAGVEADERTWTHQRVVAILERHGPSTDQEIAHAYEYMARQYDWPPCSPSGLRTRRSELQRDGKVRDTGERRRTVAGRGSIVWALVGNDSDKTGQTNAEVGVDPRVLAVRLVEGRA